MPSFDISYLGDAFSSLVPSRNNAVCRDLLREFAVVHGPDGDMDIALILVVHRNIKPWPLREKRNRRG